MLVCARMLRASRLEFTLCFHAAQLRFAAIPPRETAGLHLFIRSPGCSLRAAATAAGAVRQTAVIATIRAGVGERSAGATLRRLTRRLRHTY